MGGQYQSSRPSSLSSRWNSWAWSSLPSWCSCPSSPQRRLHLHLYLLPSRSHQLSRLHLVPRLETWLLPAPPSPPSLSCLPPASFLLEPSPLSCPPASSPPRSSWPRGPPWPGLELLAWRQPEVEKVQQRHQAPEYRDQTLDRTTLVDKIYNVNIMLYLHYIYML